MRKRILIAFTLFVVLIVAVGYNVWRANQDPVTTPPTELAIGSQKLHAQLMDSERTEAQIEQQDWNSPSLLEQVIQAHQQRIAKLAGNSQAGEIIAHDHEAIDRLQKRIDELRAQAAAAANSAPAESAAQVPDSGGAKPATVPQGSAAHPAHAPQSSAPRPRQ